VGWLLGALILVAERVLLAAPVAGAGLVGVLDPVTAVSARP
jgi:hypothetical protein